MSYNLEKLSKELGELLEQNISVANIRASTGIFYYIQEPLPGAPILLYHHRSGFVVEMNEWDYESLKNGDISAEQFIQESNWQVGYYLGKGTMIQGAYYQPIDIIGRKDQVRRYLKIVKCRVDRSVSESVPSSEKCETCGVCKCPFNDGNWADELEEIDYRKYFKNALTRLLKQVSPSYGLSTFLCADFEEESIYLVPNWHYPNEPYMFAGYVSNQLIQELLMKSVEPDNWDEYVKKFNIYIQKNDGEIVPFDLENTLQAFFEMERLKIKDYKLNPKLTEDSQKGVIVEILKKLKKIIVYIS